MSWLFDTFKEIYKDEKKDFYDVCEKGSLSLKIYSQFEKFMRKKYSSKNNVRINVDEKFISTIVDGLKYALDESRLSIPDFKKLAIIDSIVEHIREDMESSKKTVFATSLQKAIYKSLFIDYDYRILSLEGAERSVIVDHIYKSIVLPTSNKTDLGFNPVRFNLLKLNNNINILYVKYF